jgi:hypothetical protein
VSDPPAPGAGVKPGDLKADAITNLITLSSVPDAPDSIIKDLISEILAKADSGGAASKELLSKLLEKLLDKIK